MKDVDAPTESTGSEPSKIEALLHRWLVEYNPFYLLSAASVCAGLTLVSREVAAHDSLWALVAIPLVAELYAFSLIGGAALLVRLDRRRPAVMLGLLAVLFQGDPMLHVETCSFLGVAGYVASATWLLLFFAKLFLLCRALELRLSRDSIGVLALGGFGLALLPYLLLVVDEGARSVITTLWLFALATSAVWTRRNVASAVGWDARGRRSIHGAWAILGVLVVAHAWFWTTEYYFDLSPALFGAPLVALRYARREWEIYAGAGITLSVCAIGHATGALHGGFWIVSAMAAATLGLIAMRARLERTETVTKAPPISPYRSFEPLHQSVTTVTVDVSASARPRLLIAALFAAYLAFWSRDWSGGPLPDHALWSVGVLVVACLLVTRRFRRWGLATALVPVALHLAAQRGWISRPDTALEWGGAFVGGGFAMLLGSLLATWRLVGRAQKTRVTQTG